MEVFLVQRRLLLPHDAVVLALLEDHLAVLEEVASDDEQFLPTLHTAPVHGRLTHLRLARRLGYNHSTTYTLGYNHSTTYTPLVQLTHLWYNLHTSSTTYTPLAGPPVGLQQQHNLGKWMHTNLRSKKLYVIYSVPI